MKKFIILESEKKEILNRYGLINEKVSRDLPSDIKNALSSVEKKYGVTIDDSHVDKEMDQEGQYYDDNGSENSKAKQQIEKLLTSLRSKFSSLSSQAKVVSSYRSYNKQVDTFGGKIKRDGGVSQRQKYSALPGFSQHHTGKAFDILSVEPSWWNKNSDVKKWVENNCGKFGFKVSYLNDGVLRKAEPWHLFYVGGESSNSVDKTEVIPNSKIDDYYKSDKVDPKLEKETVKQFKKSGCQPTNSYSESPTLDQIKKGDVVMRIGHKGSPVTEIQNILNRLNYDLGKCGVDGLFGPKTKKALESFQEDQSITVSSSVDKVTLERLQNPKKVQTNQNATNSEVTDDNEYVIIKSDGYKGNEVHVFFGGAHTSGYSKGTSNLSAMKKYVPYLKPYSDRKIIVITHHYNTLNNVKKYVKDKFGGVVSSIAGFSQGGRETWNYAQDSSLKLVGLIDPSTYETGIKFGSNTYLVCDPKNWGTSGFYGQTRKRLEWYCSHKDESTYSGHVFCTKGYAHMNFAILKYFYDKFGGQI
jgi:LAS superfamily LD-carboxypeptidase LdcB/peptidoglycan hydrolase-like protein with peptidoglycan-binding domain